MPRFIILGHDAPTGLHFDFMLERGATLATWSLPQPPEAGVEQAAERLTDHRAVYLDYEGPVSRGRGTVAQWDQGTYEEVAWEDDRVVVDLLGEKLECRATLHRVANETPPWRVAFG